MLELNEIYNMDCKEGLQLLDANCIDLTITSPPYDQLRVYADTLKWDFEIFKPIARELYRVTKRGGVVVWIVGDATIKGSETGTSFKQALYFKEIGFNLHDTMIYKKRNPIPLTHNRYEQAFEYMFCFSKDKPKTFNPLLEPCKTKGEYTHRQNTGRTAEASTRNRNEITETKTTKQKTNVWEYVVGVKADNDKHPAPFPEDLAKDHIISWSNKGDLVLDIFSGSGTTAVQCIENDRDFIAFEKVKHYYEGSIRRVNNRLAKFPLFGLI